MKKALKGFILFIVIGIAAYFGYTYFQNKASFAGVVHENADTILKIGVHDIKETLFFDALTAPKYYYNTNRNNQDNLVEGLEIGYNIFCYSLSHIENTYFTTLNIVNIKAFENSIQEKLEKQEVVIKDDENQKYRFAVVKNSKMVLAWNNSKLAIAFTLDSSSLKLSQIFTDVLVNDKTIKDSSHTLFQTLQNGSGDIVFTNGIDILNLNFRDNEVELHGKIFSNTTEAVPDSEVSFIPNASVVLQFSPNFKHLFKKENWDEKWGNHPFFRNNSLETSKLAQLTNGFFSFEINGTTLQKDTIITYDYDDNFEKIEQKTIQEKEVPKIYLNLGVAQESLKDYLIQTKNIEANGIVTPLPWYQWYVSENNVNTSFSTYDGVVEYQKKQTYNIFECDINFEKLQNDIRLGQTQQLFMLLDSLNISIWHAAKNQYNVAGELLGKNAKVNILTQLYFGLQTNNQTLVKEAEL